VKEWILAQSGLNLYLGLFLLLIGGAVGLPIPEDVPLVLAGVLIQIGHASWQTAFIVCYVAIILGDVIIYGVGRKIGPALYKKEWFRSRVSREKIEQIKHGLEKQSLWMIFLARHLFYLRTVTFLICGAVRMNFRRFLFADAAAAVVSVPLMLWIGFVGADQYAQNRETFTKIKTFSLWLVVIAILVASLIYFRTKNKKKLLAVTTGNQIDGKQIEENPLEHFEETT
jgi:membrane protein DedA with SNARE-associated domain